MIIILRKNFPSACRVTMAELIFKAALYGAACYQFTGAGQVVDQERRTWVIFGLYYCKGQIRQFLDNFSEV